MITYISDAVFEANKGNTDFTGTMLDEIRVDRELFESLQKFLLLHKYPERFRPVASGVQLFYNKYYWHQRSLNGYEKNGRKNAGLEQQGLKLLEEAERSYPDIDWTIVEEISNRAKKGQNLVSPGFEGYSNLEIYTLYLLDDAGGDMSLQGYVNTINQETGEKIDPAFLFLQLNIAVNNLWNRDLIELAKEITIDNRGHWETLSPEYIKNLFPIEQNLEYSAKHDGWIPNQGINETGLLCLRSNEKGTAFIQTFANEGENEHYADWHNPKMWFE